MEALAVCLGQTLSPLPEPRKAAEGQLKQVEQQPGHSIAILQLLTSDQVDAAVRQAAAVHFKNFVKYRWDPSDTEMRAIPDAEKEQIKSALVGLMLGTPELIHAQLAEALTLISRVDFPRRWDTLLPELVSHFGCGDYDRICGSLSAVNAVVGRFNDQIENEELRQELRYTVDTLVPPLLQLFRATGVIVKEQSQNAAALRSLFKAIYLICQIFYSLHHQVIPDLIEDHLKEWMEDFHTYLNYENPLLAEQDPEETTAIDRVKCSICENLNIYTMKYEEEFEPFVKLFVTDVWTLLVKVTGASAQDSLAAQAIRFLTIVSKGVHHALFNDPATLKSIVENIVLPNLRMREEEEELFEFNFQEFIRRDIEGSDSDTRRRMACELVKALVVRFQGPITELCSGYVSSLLQQYAADPNKNWKSKDCAIFLVVALTVKGRVASRGATSTNELVNIPDFFRAHILPELQAPVESQPVLKADALKFITIFRMHLPKAEVMSQLPRIIALLGAESNVVHSYAAHTIERILTIKDQQNGSTIHAKPMFSPRFTADDLLPLSQDLLRGLFGALGKPDSGENEYVMKCIMRVLSALGSRALPVLPICLAEVTKTLQVVCENPRNPVFNHYLFESVAAIVRVGVNADAASVAQFEAQLFPTFDYVLGKDVVEFAPYVFQILAQLVKARSPPLPENLYMANFGKWLSPFYWERTGNVPALVRLLQEYLKKAPTEIVQAGKLEGVLGVFQKLIASKVHDHEGFYILNSIIEWMPLSAITPYLPTIWNLLFRRLQASRTPKFVKCLAVFLSLFLCTHDPNILTESIEGVQSGLTAMLFGTVIDAKILSSISDRIEKKMVAVAITRLLVSSPLLQPETNLPAFLRILSALIAMLTGRKGEEEVGAEGGGGGGGGEGEEEEPVQYQAAFAMLANTSNKERDPAESVSNAQQFFIHSLVEMGQKRGGGGEGGGGGGGGGGGLRQYLQTLEPQTQQALAGLCADFNTTIP